MPQTEPIARGTLSSQVYTWLRQQILTGAIKQGEHLSEQAISELTGVSATPVREALRMLSGDGLVELEGRRGVRVIQPGLDEIQQCFEVRKALECLALRKACQKLGPDDMAELRRIGAMMNENSPILGEDFFEADHAFHGFFIARADNRWVDQFLSTLADFSLTVRRPLFGTTDIDGTRLEHLAVIEAVLEGRIDDAERALARHIDRVGQNVVELHRKMQEATREKSRATGDLKSRLQ